MPSPASLASSTHSRSAPSDKASRQFVHLPITSAPLRGAAGSSFSWSIEPEPIPYLGNSDKLLGIFRDRLAAQITCVSIPSHFKAEDLHREQPMVYMAIMFATSYADMNTQQELGKLIMRYLATKVIVEGTKSLDILKGLLIFIYWSVYSCIQLLKP